VPYRLEETLRRVPFLRELPESALVAVIESGVARRLEEGGLLFCEGDPTPGLLVVTAGRVKLYKLDSRGRELTLGVAASGDVVGAPASFDGGNCPYHAMAYGDDGAILFQIPPLRFQMLLESHPVITVGVVRFLAVQNRRLIEMLKAQTLHSVHARFASYLLHAAGDAEQFLLPDSNVGIAAHLGTVREVVSRTLHQFADLGYISLRGRTITVTAREQLRRAAMDATFAPDS